MQDKTLIRKELLKKRQSLTLGEVLESSEKIANILLRSDELKDATTVLSYLPLGNEVKTEKIHQYLWKQGVKVFVPYTDENFDILPCRLREDTDLCEGKFHVNVPKEKEFFQKEPDIVLVPCVGIDRSGNRIGFGKGCYDRYLNGKKSKTIALIYHFQLIPDFFASQYDVPIEKILTEDGFIK